MTPLIRKVTIRNYKSIAACQVNLEPLMFLVGPNGAGKSNFLDVFRFVADALNSTLDNALRSRGTIREVRRRSGGHPNHFALRFDFMLPTGADGHYSFRIGAKPSGGYEVQDEECIIGRVIESQHKFRVKSGKLIENSDRLSAAILPDRLFLVSASGDPAFRPVFDAFSGMQVYNLAPRAIAAMQMPDPGLLLLRDGSNAASVLQNLSEKSRSQVSEMLQEIVPGISNIEAKTLGSQETIEFRQAVKGQDNPWRFLAASMSDGTLRALGVLLAVFQSGIAGEEKRLPGLIGLEEPEAALHPAASSVLLGALRIASRNRQILVTSHSPDLLDNAEIPAESLLAVDNDEGQTRIGPIDKAGREALKQQLFTAGELLRLNQLAPDPASLTDVRQDKQLDLFDFL